jgi:spermidine synthase
MRALVLACFFLSGASGLVLELVWTRMLTLVFGSTTLAISTVLTAFMGGLGLGSYLAGRFADKVAEPVKAYAWAEAAIGIYALIVPLIMTAYPGLNQGLWAAFGDRYGLLSVLRFLASAALLLLPTTLMGATFPLLSRYFISRPWELGNASLRLGTLYAMNLFGAVAGSFLAGFVFLPSVGVRATNVIAASFNLTLALAVLVARRILARRPPPPPSLEEVAAEVTGDAGGPPIVITPRARRAVLFGFVISGAAAMTLQVLWTRALAVVIGSSIYSFTIILLAFLIGLGAGSAVFGRTIRTHRHPVSELGLLHLCIAVAIGASYLLADELPYLFTWLLSSTTFDVDAVLVCQFVLACIALLPVTVLMGGVFPITMRVVAARHETVGRDVGSAYALNTVGAITGSFLSGFVVLPSLGLERGIYVVALAGLVVAALLAAVAPGLPPRRRTLGVALAVGLAVAGPLLPRWNLTNLSIGFFRVSIARDYIQRKNTKQDWQRPKLVFYEDGVATTVSVDNWGRTYSLKNNGKVDASSEADMPTQIMVGLLPLLLYPHDPAVRPPRVALVGFGSGVTAGAITQYPIKSLEVVELEGAIYRASHFFDHVNNKPLEDPRVTARVGDGRNFLSQRSDRFDVIVSEPSNPWITGVSNLFTAEYFREIKQRLEPDGIFCQWAQLYELAPWNIKSIFKTLGSEFPYVYVFAAEDLSSDTIAIASLRPLSLDLSLVARNLAHPATAREARRAGVHDAGEIPSQLLFGPEEIDAFTAGATINTDDNARIEFSAPRDLLGHARLDPYLAKVYGAFWPYGRLRPHVAGLAEQKGPEAAATMARLARGLVAHGKKREALIWLARARAAGSGPEVEHAQLLLDLLATREDRDPEVPLTVDEELAAPVVPPELAPEHAARVRQDWIEARALARTRRYATAYKLLEPWPAALWNAHLGQDFTLFAGFLDYKAGLFADAIEALKPLAGDDAFVRRRPALLYYLGRAHFSNADYTKAVTALERYVELQRAAGQPLLPASAHSDTDAGRPAPERSGAPGRGAPAAPVHPSPPEPARAP